MRYVCVAALGALLPGMAASPIAKAAYEPIADDGFECRDWYVDADADTFGAPGTGVLSCTAIVGRVPRADDCNDTDPQIHPLAIDQPDPNYVDANCDGEDGDANRAIHVALDGANAVDCGSRTTPCATVPFAITRRSIARPDVYVKLGTHAGPVVVPPLPGASNPGIYGGFGSNWVRAPLVVSRITGGTLATLNGGTGGIHVDGATLELGGLEITAPDASGANGLAGRTSAGVVARNATLTIWNCRIEAGRGSNGVTGVAAGAPPPQAMPGGPGGNAASFTTCNTALGGAGGGAGTNSCPESPSTLGGAGGTGGAADTSCFPFNPLATAGTPGLNAPTISGTAGTGGAAGSGGISCGTPGPGNPGVMGQGGAGGGPGSGGSLVSGNWVSANGGAGALGTNGGGGGGGGGSGGCDLSGGNASGAGGGGGGAGGCRAAQPGGGGGGGGASIAVLLTNTVANVTGSALVTEGGGNGGSGGSGGLGQQGGSGGSGGMPAGGGAAGGQGGAGGRGGTSGGGGGGAGGPSYGILRSGGTLNANAGIANTFQLGPAGLGGSAGPPAPGGNPGAPGANGASGNVVQF
jgi:hypothetical protein